MKIIAERPQRSKDRSDRVCPVCNLNDPSVYMELSPHRSGQLQRLNVFSNCNDPNDGNLGTESVGKDSTLGRTATTTEANRKHY